MIIDFWLYTTDANGDPTAADALPSVSLASNVSSISVVSAGTGVYSVRATLMDSVIAASVLLSWQVDTIDYFQQVVFSGGKANLTANAISSVTAAGVTITPAAGTVPDRAGTTGIVGYVQETNTISITITDAAGDPVDVSGKTLGAYFETEDNRTAVASVTSGITVTGAGNNVVNFAKPSTVSTSERRLIYAVRDQAAPKTVYVGGVLDVQYLPAGS